MQVTRFDFVTPADFVDGDCPRSFHFPTWRDFQNPNNPTATWSLPGEYSTSPRIRPRLRRPRDVGRAGLCISRRPRSGVGRRAMGETRRTSIAVRRIAPLVRWRPSSGVPRAQTVGRRLSRQCKSGVSTGSRQAEPRERAALLNSNELPVRHAARLDGTPMVPVRNIIGRGILVAVRSPPGKVGQLTKTNRGSNVSRQYEKNSRNLGIAICDGHCAIPGKPSRGCARFEIA